MKVEANGFLRYLNMNIGISIYSLLITTFNVIAD